MVEADANQSDTAEPEDRWTDYMNSFAANDESVSDVPMADSYPPLPTYLKRYIYTYYTNALLLYQYFGIPQ
jgi:hypothetical protein